MSAVRKRARRGEVRVVFGSLGGEPDDVVVLWGGAGATKRHANVLFAVMSARVLPDLPGGSPETVASLLKKHFDMGTLDIRISVKPTPPTD